MSGNRKEVWFSSKLSKEHGKYSFKMEELSGVDTLKVRVGKNSFIELYAMGSDDDIKLYARKIADPMDSQMIVEPEAANIICIH